MERTEQDLALPNDHDREDNIGDLLYRRRPDGEWEWWFAGWRPDGADGPSESYPGTVVSYESTWAEPYYRFESNFWETV